MKLGNLSFIQNRIWNVYIRGGKKNLKRQTANWWFPDSSLFACLAVCTLYVLVCVMMLNVIVLIRCCWWALTIRNFWFRVTWTVEPHLAALMVSLSCVAFCCRVLPYLLFLVLLLDTSKKKTVALNQQASRIHSILHENNWKTNQQKCLQWQTRKVVHSLKM